jgi:hypothetical protein
MFKRSLMKKEATPKNTKELIQKTSDEKRGNPEKCKGAHILEPCGTCVGLVHCSHSTKITHPKMKERNRAANHVLAHMLAYLSHRIICKHIDANCSFHPGVLQGIKSTGKQ